MGWLEEGNPAPYEAFGLPVGLIPGTGHCQTVVTFGHRIFWCHIQMASQTQTTAPARVSDGNNFWNGLVKAQSKAPGH